MKNIPRLLTLVVAALSTAVPLTAAESPFVGRWAFATPEGRAAWLGVEESGGKLSASLLWGGGSVLPASEVTVKDGALTVKRLIKGKDTTTTHVLTATASGTDGLAVTTVFLKENGTEANRGTATARRLPALPPKPDLSKVSFGEPIKLIPSSGLEGWSLVEKDAPNGWSVAEGVLSNRVEKVAGKRFANLRTDASYEDFRLTTEVRTLPESNSGIYLRGVYEIQIAETFGKPVDSHNMGAVYSRITPAVAAEKAIGEWQTLEITLVDRHITVVLNGKTIIDNQPVLGCTGGALTSDDSLPGPILLQGDHTSIDYRNMVLTPVKK